MSRFKVKEGACRSAIKKTLAYSAVFDYPLSFNQLATLLILNNKVDFVTFTKELGKLCSMGEVIEHEDKYFLKTVKPVVWKDRLERANKILKDNSETFELLGKIPWLKFIGVTGSVAAHNPTEDADIDIFVITAHKRLWLTRFFLVLLLKATGKYRTDKKPAGKICPNLMIDEADMCWPEKKRNLYVAQEIIRMQPVFDRGEMYFAFVNANKWVNRFAAGFANIELKHEVKLKSNFVVNVIEKLIHKMQHRYMKAKITAEHVTDKLIHFNKSDNTMRILDKFDKVHKT